MFPKPDGTNTVGKSAAANPGTAEAGIAFNQNTLGTRPNAQSPTAALNTGEAAATNFNNNLNNNIRTSAASTNTGTIPAAPAQLASVGSPLSPPAAVNSNNTVGPSKYPQAPTGAGVESIAFGVNSPQPLNTNPFANAGRTQTIVKEA